jgi:hypothetical protein
MHLCALRKLFGEIDFSWGYFPHYPKRSVFSLKKFYLYEGNPFYNNKDDNDDNLSNSNLSDIGSSGSSGSSGNSDKVLLPL